MSMGRHLTEAKVLLRPMWQLIMDIRRKLMHPRANGDHAAREILQERQSTFESIRDVARDRLRREQPKLDVFMTEDMKEQSRIRMRCEYPNLDEATVGEIVENVPNWTKSMSN